MWTLGGIRVFAQDLKEDVSQIIPRLQPLSGGTVLQNFGHEDDIRTLLGIVVGQSDKDALKGMTTGGSVELVSPEGSEGDFEVKSVKVNRLMVICQTLRPDLPENSPVYNVEIELYV
jgi:hypothetical protein